MKKIIGAVNLIGILCLIHFAIPYLTHDTVVRSPDAMLPAEAWDAAGMALTIGLLPLVVVNVLGFFATGAQKRFVRVLWFFPSVLCLVMVICYWTMT